MKKRNFFLISFIAVLLSFFCLTLKTNTIKAKEVNTEDFTISIGEENSIYPKLVLNENSSVYTLNFPVKIMGNKTAVGPQFNWTNKMYYYIDNTYYEEIDTLNPTDEISYFDVNGEYFYNIYDSDLPSYTLGGIKPIDKVYFQSTFTCINCGAGEEYENYQHQTQISEIIELNVLYDYTKPTLCENESLCSYPEGGTYINDVAFRFMITDNESGLNLNSLKYAFLTNSNPTSSEITNPLILGAEIYYTPDRGDLINSEQVYQSVYLYVFAEDNVGNYIFYRISSIPYRYNFDKIENNLEYNKSASSIPSQDEFYKSLNIKIESETELYYRWFDDPFSNALAIKENGTLYDKEAGITFSTTGTGEAYLHVVSFTSETEFTFMILKYQFDNYAPSVLSSNYPTEGETYQNVTLNFSFNDYYGKVDKSYYLLTNTILTGTQLNQISNEYIDNTNLTLGTNLDGTYYIYFIVYDTAGNYRYFYLTYIFDNTAPILTLSVNENDALKVSNGKSIKLTVNELQGNTFKCKWALSDLTLSEADLDATCTNNGSIDVPKNSEGYYRLWAYLEDTIGNSTLYSSYPFLVDSKGPIIEITSLYKDEVYRDNNQITVESKDNYTGVSMTLYKWYLYDQSVSNGNSFSSSISETIKYPSNAYGIYALWVYAIDGAGNSTLYKDKTKYYVDTEEYTLSLKGKERMQIVQNEKFIDPGVNALKGKRELNYEVVSNLNVKKPGTYTITYKFQGLEVTREVVVSKTTQYYLIIGISIILGLIISFVPLKRKR